MNDQAPLALGPLGKANPRAQFFCELPLKYFRVGVLVPGCLRFRPFSLAKTI